MEFIDATARHLIKERPEGFHVFREGGLRRIEVLRAVVEHRPALLLLVPNRPILCRSAVGILAIAVSTRPQQNQDHTERSRTRRVHERRLAQDVCDVNLDALLLKQALHRLGLAAGRGGDQGRREMEKPRLLAPDAHGRSGGRSLRAPVLLVFLVGALNSLRSSQLPQVRIGTLDEQGIDSAHARTVDGSIFRLGERCRREEDQGMALRAESQDGENSLQPFYLLGQEVYLGNVARLDPSQRRTRRFRSSFCFGALLAKRF
mmetsp:Transcript_3130/g.12562  ORF Transcript_3130/g.12562 Transcript_3130/m.12562 type:complete len:261 (+) Transcript_3130:73-855(+)